MRAPCLPLLALAIALAPRAARAHSVADTVTFGTTQSSPGNPRSSWVSNRASGEWDPRDWLALRLDFTWTYDIPTPPPASAAFPTSARNIFLGNLGIDFLPNDHWILSLDAFGSPRSTGVDDRQVPITVMTGGRTTTGTIDSEVRRTSWSAGGALMLSYDTDSDGKFNTVADLSAGFSWFESEQSTLKVVDRQGMIVTEQQLRDECQARPRGGACQLAKTLSPLTSATGQIRLALDVTETFSKDTDVGLGGAYYVYTADPTLSVEKGTNLIRGSIDNALPLAPYWYTARIELAQRIKGFSASGYFQYGRYLEDAAYDYNLAGGLRLAYKHKWGKTSLKITLSGTVQGDTDSTGAPFISGTVSLGARARF